VKRVGVSARQGNVSAFGRNVSACRRIGVSAFRERSVKLSMWGRGRNQRTGVRPGSTLSTGNRQSKTPGSWLLTPGSCLLTIWMSP
jgi:hypothetical protein